MMYKSIMKFIIVGIPVSWAILSMEQINNSTFLEFPTYTNLCSCKNIEFASNFFNVGITDIGSDFIKYPSVTCLNLMNNSIKTIAKDSFRNLSNLAYLFLSNNKVCSLNGIYNFGSHEKLNVLVLNNVMSNKSGRIIGNFGYYPNLEILLARNNNFTDLQSEVALSYASLTQKIPFPKLKFLDLSENSIGYFDEYYFRSGYSNKIEFINLWSNTLRFLDLHDNKLHFLFLHERGSNLHALNVNNNYFQSVMYTRLENDKIYPASLELANLHNLRYLSISGNKIQHLGLDVFKDSNKLIYLNLSKNNLKSHDNYYCLSCFEIISVFANLHFLQVLDLSSNHYKIVPRISNENVNVLDLSCNKIEFIINNVFVKTPKLTKLLLGGNRINRIEARAFAGLFALEKLDFSSNKLNSLPEGWTKSLTSLKYLDLSNNTFIYLESLSLKSVLPLMEVYLVMNPLKYANITCTKNLQSLTVHLAQKSNFACKCIA